MRSLLLILLFANLVVFASQFDVVRGLIVEVTPVARPSQVNAERLRIVRDTSLKARPPAPAENSEAADQPPSGTNSR